MYSSDSEDEVQLFFRLPRFFRPRTNYAFLPVFEYNERFRLSNEKFVDLLNSIEPFLQRPTRRSQPLTPQQQLQIGLHWLATGAQYHAISDMHGVSKASVCRVVKCIVALINELVLPRLVEWPENVAGVVGRFNEVGGMPLVCGVVDGTLIKIDAPSIHEEQYVDRHGKHSINTMEVAGPDLQFYYCSANWPGSTNDARVLRASNLAQRMEAGWRPFADTVLLGDSIYPLKPWLIPPIIRNPEDPSQRRFLRAHRQTRRLVENAIGILKEMFPCLNHLRLEPVKACEVIQCCVALCNLSREPLRQDVQVVDEDGIEEYGDVPANEEVDEGGAAVLQALYDHFA